MTPRVLRLRLFAPHVEHFMRRAQMNGPDLAAELGVSRQRVHQIVRGDIRLAEATVRRLARAIGAQDWRQIVAAEERPLMKLPL